MAVRVWLEDVDEPVIWNDDGSLIGEESGDEYEAEPGEEVETEDGQEFTWREEHAQPTPEYALREAAEASREASERHIEFLTEQEIRQNEEDEETDERRWEAEQAYTDGVIRLREEREGFARMFHQHRQEYERQTGQVLTEDEAESLFGRMWNAHERGHTDYTLEDAMQAEFPDGPPERSQREQLEVAWEDAEREATGGLTREAAVAKIDRSGEPQNFSLEYVGDGPDGEGRYEVVRSDG